MTTTPPILRLPLELRQQIYSHLLPRENTSHPLPSVGITSVSHRPPTSALLNIHPQLTDEILDYFYSISTWKLIFSHAFNFFRVDPDLRRLEASPSLPRLRKVELVFYCDVLLLREYPSFGLESFCREIRRRASRACDVLLHATELRSVTVSWVDTTGTGGWGEKAGILAPLAKLLDRDVVFHVGNVSGSEDVDRGRFIKAMEDVLGDRVNPSESLGGAKTVPKGGLVPPPGLDGAGEDAEDPAKLRLLAFDPRQDRNLYSNHDRDRFTRPVRCSAVAGTAGWTPVAFS